MFRQRLNNFIGLCSLLLPLHASALQEDWNQEIIILSDRAELDRKSGVVIYQGDVVLTQGTLRIESDRLVVVRNEGRMEKAIAEGGPARYQQQIKPDTATTHAEAQRIEYLAAEQTAILTGQARLRQESNEITGERIRYNMNTEVVSAGQHDGAETPSRIRVVIQPQPAAE